LDINLFTTKARTEFLRGMQSVPENELLIAPFVTFVPSGARIETYLWMTPSPGISEYVGRRRLAKLDQTKLLVENKEFDGSISVSTRDVEDDLVGGYPLRFNELGAKAEQFPERWVLQKLANGANVVGFDTSNFFASSHVWGSGGITLPAGFGGAQNNLTFSAASGDAATGKIVFMVTNKRSGPIKPILYQKRKGPKLATDAGTPASMKAKQADYWVDLEAEALVGYWWDSILVTITNTPTVTECMTIIDTVIAQFLSFQLPVALSSDPPMYVHQGMDMLGQIGVAVVSPVFAQRFAHVLMERKLGVSLAGATAGLSDNIYFERFKLIASGYMV